MQTHSKFLCASSLRACLVCHNQSLCLRKLQTIGIVQHFLIHRNILDGFSQTSQMMKICFHLRTSYPFESPQEALQPLMCKARVERFTYKMKSIENQMFPYGQGCMYLPPTIYIQSIKFCWKATDHGISVILEVTHAQKVMDRFNMLKRQACLSSQHSWKKSQKISPPMKLERDLHARESLCWAMSMLEQTCHKGVVLPDKPAGLVFNCPIG